MSDSKYRGGCFCGAVRYQATGKARNECFCHCESCRRAAGATPVAWVTFDEAALTISGDALTTHESSPRVIRGFCGSCGTSLTYQHGDRAGEVDVTLVTFDEGSGLVPKRHVWVEDKPSWVEIDDGLPQLERV